MTHTKDEALKLAKECGATTYTNRHYPEATAVTFSPMAWEKFCEQALAAPVQEPVAKVDANDEGYWADILPDRTVKVGQFLYSTPPAAPVQEPLMVDMHPPATRRDRWMYEQGRLAERDPRSHTTPPAAQPAADIEIMLDAEEDERRAQPAPVPLTDEQSRKGFCEQDAQWTLSLIHISEPTRPY